MKKPRRSNLSYYAFAFCIGWFLVVLLGYFFIDDVEKAIAFVFSQAYSWFIEVE